MRRSRRPLGAHGKQGYREPVNAPPIPGLLQNLPQPDIQASRFKSQVNSAKLLRANGV